jgi:F-type H+-transporting ATPase subunit delta
VRPPSRVSRRYANALYHVARRENAVDAVSADLGLMRDIFLQNPSILEALAVLRIPHERKKAALQAIVGVQMKQAVSRRFLDMMVDHAREASLPETVAAYALLSDEANGIVSADVRSAAPMDEGQAARLKTKLDALTGLNTRINVSTDPSLVGGLIVRIGDTVMDGSVKGYLEQIGNRLRSATMPSVSVEAMG